MPYAKDNGIRIHYETEGEGPPLVLLHPYPGWLEMWSDLGYVAALRDDYRLVLIDQRGFGASDKPHQPGAYDLEAMASDVIAVLDDLGIPQAHIWGYSMGARIAWGLAHFHRERCRSLTIGADFPFEPDPAEPMPEWMRGQVEMLQHGQESFVTALMGLFAPWLKPEWDWAERLASMDLQALMAQRAIPRRVGLLQALPGLDVPFLLYAGDQDPYLGFLEGWVKRLGNATLVALPGTTHPQGIFERDLILPHAKAFLAGVEEAREGEQRAELTTELWCPVERGLQAAPQAAAIYSGRSAMRDAFGPDTLERRLPAGSGIDMAIGCRRKPPVHPVCPLWVGLQPISQYDGSSDGEACTTPVRIAA